MRSPIAFLFLLVSSISFAQTTDQKGSYTNSSNWTGDVYPGSLNSPTNDLLTLDEEDIYINHRITLGEFTSRIDIDALGNNPVSGSLNINDTLIIYGNVDFANKSMPINISSGGILIILGNLSMDNKITIASSGVMVVSGDFNMSGSTGHNDYSSSGGAVYAGSYSGNAEVEIDAANGADESFIIDSLSNDGMQDIEDFINGNGETPLPITLGSFNLKLETNKVALTWTTLSEENFDYFEIQRAGANGNFEVIATVNGNGWSSEVISYNYLDDSPLSGLSMYRLESVDFDGYRETFPAKAINVKPINKAISFYPNVLQGESEINLDYSGELFISVIDIKGAIAFETVVSEGLLELPALPTGQYTLKYQTQENHFGHAKLSIR